MKNFSFILFFILVLLGCAPLNEEQEYIVVGVLLPLTGNDSDEGMRALNGLQLAKQEINESGGVLGKKLDLIIFNDRGDAEYILRQYEALKKHNVAAIIGSSYSDVTLPFAEAAEKDGIPVISPTASDPNITIDRKYIFRANFIDDYQAEVMAFFANNYLQAKTAVVLFNKNSASFKNTSSVFTEKFKEYGGIIFGVEAYSNTDEYSEILRKYSVNKPDIIFCPEDYFSASKLVNAVYNSALRGAYILGTDVWDGLLVYISNPDAMKNVFYSSPFSFDDQDIEVIQFVRKYFGAFSQIPLSGSAAAYTCVYILAEAFKTAGNTNKDDVVSAMKLNELNLITGHIKFDEHNNPRTNVYIIQIDGGIYSTYKKLRL